MKRTGSSESTMSAQNTVGNDSVVVQTTEGWLELFLTPSEKATFSNWKEELNDKSLTHWLTRDLFYTLSSYIPDTVAPNVVTLAGLLCLGQAWYITNIYGEDYPKACTWFSVLNIFLFFLTNSMETYHADRIRQRTALGELFMYSCNSCSTVFLAILTTYCLGGESVKIQWYAVQASQLVLFLKHLSAFHRKAGLRYNVFTGPGEVIMTSIVLLTLRATNGLDWLLELHKYTIHRLVTQLDVPVRYQEDPTVLGMELVMLTYYALYVVAVVKCLCLKKPHGWSRFGLSASLLMRSIPAVFLHFGVTSFDLKTVDVICDGFFMAVLTSDVTLAKMAGREIHPWVVLMSMAAVLSHSTILALVLVYYIAVFADLCAYLNMPLLTTCRNVYCDGVYDLCHIGHKMLFKKLCPMAIVSLLVSLEMRMPLTTNGHPL